MMLNGPRMGGCYLPDCVNEIIWCKVQDIEGKKHPYYKFECAILLAFNISMDFSGIIPPIISLARRQKPAFTICILTHTPQRINLLRSPNRK